LEAECLHRSVRLHAPKVEDIEHPDVLVFELDPVQA
jgi:hypothetical protein